MATTLVARSGGTVPAGAVSPRPPDEHEHDEEHEGTATITPNTFTQGGAPS